MINLLSIILVSIAIYSIFKCVADYYDGIKMIESNWIYEI